MYIFKYDRSEDLHKTELNVGPDRMTDKLAPLTINRKTIARM